MVLVFVHEMGHFLFAKLFKMRVDKFSVGFPPKIVGKKIGETEYVLGATPLGGYVKIAGMVDESMDTEFAETEAQPWEFRAKPVWQRIVVICAGVVFNIILAAFIFIGLKYFYGDAQPVATDDGSVFVADSSVAYQMGLRTGDRLLSISGQAFDPYAGTRTLDALLADELTIEIDRNGERRVFQGPDDIMTQLTRSGGLGLSFEPSLVGEVIQGMPAEGAGLQVGDLIVAIDSQSVQFWVQMTGLIQDSEGGALNVVWIRPETPAEEPGDTPGALPSLAGGERFEASITPKQQNDRYVIGVGQAVRFETFSLGKAFAAGIEDTWFNTKNIAINLKRIFTGRENLRENLGGPVMVAKIIGQEAQAGAYFFWRIVALLSITLAIINILPIPALDGGHLVFLIYEGITRREPSIKVRMWTQQIGMVLLLTLMVFLVINDILRL